MATTSPKRRTAAARQKSRRTAPSNGRQHAAEPTKASTKPEQTPGKAHKPEAAAKAGRPKKAHKPEAAAQAGRPEKAHKPEAAAQAGRPKKAHKPEAAAHAGRPEKAHKPKPGKSGGPDRGKRSTGSDSSPGEALVNKAEEVLTGDAGPGKAVTKMVQPGPGKRMMLKLAWKAGKHVVGKKLPDIDFEGMAPDGASLDGARQALARGVTGVQGLSQRMLESAATSTEPTSRRRPPIQGAVEVNVPLHVAWSEWRALAWLPEGVDDVLELKRSRDGRLRGRLVRGQGTWKAEILDEREQDSFAWRSHAGSDCAGLITFHELDTRLTRIEVSLDVVPTSVAQAAAVKTRLADRRVDADLRRLKAHLELINPDLYDGDGDESDA